MGDDKRNDIISEQSFVIEQASGLALSARSFRSLEAIEDREFEDRESVKIATGLEDLNSALSPEADSPGDSEEDVAAEIMLGMNFRPPGEDAFEEDEADETIEDFEKTDRTNYSEEKSASASENPSAEKAESRSLADRETEPSQG